MLARFLGGKNVRRNNRAVMAETMFSRTSIYGETCMQRG